MSVARYGKLGKHHDGMILRAARTALGPSTARIGKGIGEASRTYLGGLDIGRFAAVETERGFRRVLDTTTRELFDAMPACGSWGIARKALNIFLRSIVYNHHVRTAYGLGKLEPWLEVPLDSIVGKALARQFRELPRWDSLRRLTSEANRQYQDAATEFALREGYPDRIHIDDVLWAAPRP